MTVKNATCSFDPRRSGLYHHPIWMASERPISDVKELVAHFESGCKPASQERVGLEHEKIAVLGDGRAPGYDLIARLLEEEAKRRGWERVEEHGKIIALQDASGGGRRGTVTLEPGGQVEHSGAPWPSAVQASRDNDQHLDELIPTAAELGISFLAIGFRPFGTIDDVPWMPKGRYRVMRNYLPQHGKKAHEMMKRTTTVQANLDYRDEGDAMDKLRLGLGLSSLVTSLFAASPIVDGKASGYQSYRASCWLECDPDRCGLLPFAFADGASFRDYVEWALDVPMFFLYRGGEYREIGQGITFRRFLHDGLEGERATEKDWELHLSTLFPEVRLKKYVEVRQADASSREMVRALPALWRGLLYVAESRRAAWELVANWTLDERLDLYRRTPKEGLRAKIRGIPVQRLAAEMIAIAKQGLLTLGSPDGAAMLQPLEEIAATGRTLADEILALHQQHDGNPRKLIEALRLR
jgi:glutamate--cysteine ligase